MAKRQNGEGSIYKIVRDGKVTGWRAQLTLGIKDDGSYRRISVSGKTQAEVKAKKIELEEKYKQGLLVDKTKITLAIKDNDFYYSNSTFAYIKSDKFYSLDLNMNMYYEMDNFDDFDMVFHIFPSKLDGFEAYDHGFSKVFGKKYYYESYHIDRYNVSYFFKGNDIIYINVTVYSNWIFRSNVYDKSFI